MLKGFVFSVCSASCFGFLAVFAKIGYNFNISTGNMLFLRFFFGSFIFLLYFTLTDYRRLFIKKENLIKAIFAGTVLYFIQSNFFFLSIKNTSVSTAALILYLYPLFVATISYLLFKTALNNVSKISLVLIIVGSCFIFYDAFTKQNSFLGVMFALGASITFSFYLIFIQYSLKTQKPVTFSFYVMVSAAFSFYLITDKPFAILNSMGGVILVFCFSFISTFLAILLLYLAIDKIGSVYTSIFSSVEPSVTVLASVLILKEQVNYFQITGMFIIIFSVIMPGILSLRGEFAKKIY